MLTRMVSISRPWDPPASASQSAGITGGFSHSLAIPEVAFLLCWLLTLWGTSLLVRCSSTNIAFHGINEIISKTSIIKLFLFSSGFAIWGLTYKSFNTSWVDFCVWCKIRVLFSFACNPASPVPFVEETIVSPLCILSTFVEDQLTVCRSWFSDSILFHWFICLS